MAALAAASSLLLAACSGPAEEPSEQERQTVKFGISVTSWSGGVASLVVSDANGYFDEEGIDVEWVMLESGSTVAQQIAGGAIDVGAVTPEPVIIGASEDLGLDLLFFASYYAKPIYGIAAPKESGITEVTDLKGKTVGVGTLGGLEMTNAVVALNHAGIDPADVNFLAIGFGAQQAAAVANGTVDAVSLWDTQIAALENTGLDMHILDLPSMGDITSGGLAAKRETFEEKKDLYAKIGRAVAKGVYFAQANPEAAIKVMYDTHPETKSSTVAEAEALANDIRVLETRLRSIGVPTGQQWGVLTEENLAASVDYLLTAELISKPVDAKSLFTDELLDEMNDFDVDAIVTDARGR